jgi:RecA/RadA recombinase
MIHLDSGLNSRCCFIRHFSQRLVVVDKVGSGFPRQVQAEAHSLLLTANLARLLDKTSDCLAQFHEQVSADDMLK